MTERFAICIEAGEYDGFSLQRWKVYPVLEDAKAQEVHWIRVVDESGEDYLYPGNWFSMVDLSEPVAELYRSVHQR